MTETNANYIRETFLSFMEKKGHLKIKGASIIPDNDPSLLFINAGMAPMKSYFSGAKQPPQTDLCNVQPCIRTIDIEDVGDAHHLTFFEMLGSWSINNYFKDKAIELAYELLTEKLQFPKEKLYVSVYGGESEKGLPPDEDSAKFWQKVGVPASRIITLGEDNFWSAGDIGPCGPCTEVFYDTENPAVPSYEETGNFDDKNRYIEIWNAGVFMQYNKTKEGTYENLPFVSVDTGSGLERLTMALNGKANVYDTDIFQPYLDYVCKELKIPADSEKIPSARRIADHMRAATLIIAEGVVPGREGRNYIPRRLIRRCASIALLHDKPNFSLINLSKHVIENMGDSYPILKEQAKNIEQVIAAELITFQKSVKRGVQQFDKMAKSSELLTGKQIFDLRSTFGMPLDLIAEIAKERNILADIKGFEVEFLKHQKVSKTRE